MKAKGPRISESHHGRKSHYKEHQKDPRGVWEQQKTKEPKLLEFNLPAPDSPGRSPPAVDLLKGRFLRFRVPPLRKSALRIVGAGKVLAHDSDDSHWSETSVDHQPETLSLCRTSWGSGCRSLSIRNGIITVRITMNSYCDESRRVGVNISTWGWVCNACRADDRRRSTRC